MEVEGGIRLARACCVSYIMHKYSVKFYQPTAAKLMMALLVKPDNEHSKCTDYDQLVSVHIVSDSWRRFVFLSHVNVTQLCRMQY